MCHEHYVVGTVFVTEDSNSRGHSCNSVLKLSRAMKTSIVKTGKFLKTQTRCRKKDIHSTLNCIGGEWGGECTLQGRGGRRPAFRDPVLNKRETATSIGQGWKCVGRIKEGEKNNNRG